MRKMTILTITVVVKNHVIYLVLKILNKYKYIETRKIASTRWTQGSVTLNASPGSYAVAQWLQEILWSMAFQAEDIERHCLVPTP